MADIKLITERDMKGENPLHPSSQFCEDFILLNMYPDGIWLVDKQHSKWVEIKKTAIGIAQAFGDKETINKLSK